MKAFVKEFEKQAGALKLLTAPLRILNPFAARNGLFREVRAAVPWALWDVPFDIKSTINDIGQMGARRHLARYGYWPQPPLGED